MFAAQPSYSTTTTTTIWNFSSPTGAVIRTVPDFVLFAERGAPRARLGMGK